MKLVAPIIRTIIFGCISWSVLFATRLLMLPFDLSPYVWLLIQAVVSIVAGVLAGLLLRGKLYSAHLEIKSLSISEFMSPSNPDSLYILISISLFDPTVHGFLTIMGVTFLASCIQWRTPKQVTKSNWVHIRIILDKCWWGKMCWPLSTISTMRPIYLF